MPPPKYSRSTSTSYPKGSPARRVVKTSSTSPSFFGYQRSASTTVVNGTPTASSSHWSFTPASSGGGGGGGLSMVGPLLIIGGVFMLWVVFRGKSGAVWNAITGNNSFSANLDAMANAISPTASSSSSGGGGKSGASNGVTSNAPDSGTHMGIDSNGNIITINSSYGNMTNEQKDAANAYAHQIGNVG